MNGFYMLSSFSFSFSYSQTVGTTGSTPLHFAAANGCLNVVDILLRHGAIVDMTDKVCALCLSISFLPDNIDSLPLNEIWCDRV